MQTVLWSSDLKQAVRNMKRVESPVINSGSLALTADEKHLVGSAFQSTSKVKTPALGQWA